MKTLLWAGLAIAAAGILIAAAGCESEAVYSSPPQYLTVGGPPPAPVVEPAPAPREGYTWIDGYWEWDKDQYRWRHSHWEKPPKPYAYWVPPVYEHSGDEYRYTPGHWREGPEPAERD